MESSDTIAMADESASAPSEVVAKPFTYRDKILPFIADCVKTGTFFQATKLIPKQFECRGHWPGCGFLGYSSNGLGVLFILSLSESASRLISDTTVDILRTPEASTGSPNQYKPQFAALCLIFCYSLILFLNFVLLNDYTSGHLLTGLSLCAGIALCSQVVVMGVIVGISWCRRKVMGFYKMNQIQVLERLGRLERLEGVEVREYESPPKLSLKL